MHHCQCIRSPEAITGNVVPQKAGPESIHQRRDPRISQPRIREEEHHPLGLDNDDDQPGMDRLELRQQIMAMLA